MKQFLAILLFFAFFGLLQLNAQNTKLVLNDSSEINNDSLFTNTQKHHRAAAIPEPMVFDLVRPLGALKGELEANSLFIAPLRRKGAGLYWAPEIEYAFADGYAIELELPMYNNVVKAYKIAFQGTLKQTKNQQFVHGWQWISEYLAEEKALESTLLYLSGYNFGNGLSVFAMIGVRHQMQNRSTEELNRQTPWDALFNFTINQKLSKRFILSVESNFAKHINVGNEFRLIPQVSTKITDALTLQFGAGFEKYLGESMPVGAFRLTKEL